MCIEGGPLPDVIFWPVQIFSNLPRRLGRLFGGLVATAKARSLNHLGYWLHAFFWYLFDVTGGPELAQLLLRLLTVTRPLTRNEIQVVSKVLGKRAILYGDVRIATGGVLRYAFQLNKNRAFATWHTINLPEHRLDDIPLLVHELTHVFQYERVGSFYIGQGLWAQARLGRKAYEYGGRRGLTDAMAAGKRYCDYNREQQGQIAQDYCALLQSNQDTSAYEPYINQLQSGAL